MLIYIQNQHALINLDNISTITLEDRNVNNCSADSNHVYLNFYALGHQASIYTYEKSGLEILDKILTAKNNKQEILII